MTAIADLCAMLRAAGAVPSFDARRHSRAARSWPDYLPPMFPIAELHVERWEPDTAAGWVEGGPIHRRRAAAPNRLGEGRGG